MCVLTILIWDSDLQNLETNFLFKAPNLWYFIMAGPKKLIQSHLVFSLSFLGHPGTCGLCGSPPRLAFMGSVLGYSPIQTLTPKCFIWKNYQGRAKILTKPTFRRRAMTDAVWVCHSLLDTFWCVLTHRQDSLQGKHQEAKEPGKKGTSHSFSDHITGWFILLGKGIDQCTQFNRQMLASSRESLGM